jgi:hypothetical protein
VGLALPTNVIQLSLGITILGIVAIMLTAKKSAFPDVPKADALSSALRITGVYYEPSARQDIDWKVHRTPMGLATFVIIGFMAGMFGLGAGWANVPVLNLMMGAPLKISVATSKFLLSITDTSAAWIYLNKGCVIPMMVVPSLIGIMLGSFVGARISGGHQPEFPGLGASGHRLELGQTLAPGRFSQFSTGGHTFRCHHCLLFGHCSRPFPSGRQGLCHHGHCRGADPRSGGQRSPDCRTLISIG